MNFRGKFLRLFNKVYTRELSAIVKYYDKNPFCKKNAPKIIVSALDGSKTTCGLADRLKGMLSAYAYAKATGVDFVIRHKIPFDLSMFLVPNKYDWKCKDEQVSMNVYDSRPFVLYNNTNPEKLQKLDGSKQYHFYSNVNFIPYINKLFGTEFSFHELYNELFKPSDMLMNEVRKFQPDNADYISISFRFTQLMGDFKDVVGQELDDDKKKVLIAKCHNLIERIYNEHDQKYMVLVTADSQRFIDTLGGIPYVFTLPGKIGHIGHESGMETHLKTFLDFYMISQAKKVYMGYSGRMWKSQFAQSAAETTGVPYQAIQF